MIRAVIFDFNGVLVDDEPVHYALFRALLDEEGIGLTEADYHEHYLGLDDRGCFGEALRAAGRPADRVTIDALIARKAQRYEALAETGLSYFPGAAEVLHALAERWPLAICSGALRAEIEYSLRRLGVSDRIAAIVAAEDTTRCKPDPEGYLLALERLRATHRGPGPDLDAAECLVIEDSIAGIASARAAGMAAVAVAHTYAPEELTRAGADAVLVRLDLFTPGWIDRTFGPVEPPR